MTANFFGMDINEVRGFATQLGQKAQEIDTLAQQLTQALGNTQWVGPDATSFRNEWQSQHMAALRNVATALREAQNRANANAQEQETTSAR
ncbi:MAG: hypothetical protein Q4F67_00065 [Propionibacteriaceae bacterium]|nr:hypothetical protein [Propionibacteriaceae bacterium]